MASRHDDNGDCHVSKDKRPRNNRKGNAILETQKRPFMPSSTDLRGEISQPRSLALSLYPGDKSVTFRPPDLPALEVPEKGK